MSKLKASEVAVRACEQAVQTLGGWGYIKDFPVEKWYRDAKLYTIFEGTSEIQRLVIGRALRAQARADPLDQRMEHRDDLVRFSCLRCRRSWVIARGRRSR